ncbi:mediator of RNA polymerase II transcription subunit 20-like [Sycon ciliatum]|uniref:mediator of RNA polymerase II transcription subunit 20-like n=1 Tax=Sycon ciliatum TaxID=27933 RepID=UPI0020A99238|eukprot:scpid68506/ scgid11902/ Mediator of RNA polymerase II transcription subunit 20; Mediator complex subunit 20; TRF-proximal protein homolog
MGVSTLLPIPTGPGRSTTHQQLADLEQRIITLGAKKVGLWSVHCTTYHSTSLLTTVHVNYPLHVLLSSEDESSSYAITGSGVCLSGDRDLSLIIAQLKTFYTKRLSITIEAKGPRYQLGDFLIKPGVVSMGPSAHSNILEVEYMPSCVATQCWGLLKQMLLQIMDHSNVAEMHRDPPQGHTDGVLYTRAHTMSQYIGVFSRIWGTKASR